MKNILFITIILFSNSILAATETSPSSYITQIDSYSAYSDGDVVIKISTNPTGCPQGYWLKRSDVGFKENFSMALAAYHAKANIKMTGHTDQLWPGTGGKVCRLYSIRYTQ